MRERLPDISETGWVPLCFLGSCFETVLGDPLGGSILLRIVCEALNSHLPAYLALRGHPLDV